VHVSDPTFYDELYTGISRKRNRDSFEVQGFGLPDAVLNSPDHDIHRMRRAALNPYFSRQAISRIEPVVRSKLETLCRRLEESKKGNAPVNVELAFMALTVGLTTSCSGLSLSDSYRLILSRNTALQSPMTISSTLNSVQIG
jgi:cytochrome P450